MLTVRGDHRRMREVLWLALMSALAAASMLILAGKLAGAAEYRTLVPPADCAAGLQYAEN